MSMRAVAPSDSEFYDDASTAKPAPKRKQNRHKQPPPSSRSYVPPDQRCAARLDEWCAAYNLSEVHLYRFIGEGRGPRLTRRRGLTFITRDDWYAWWKIDIPPKVGRGRQDLRRAREAAATAETATIRK